MFQNSNSSTCTALNRLVVACRDDSIALDAAAQIIHDPSQKARLTEKSERRATYRADLNSAIIALGGTPATSGSCSARIGARMRLFKGVVAGQHVGDAFAACARSGKRTEAAYASVLSLELPPDIRFGVLRQHSDIELDSKELRRLRWDHVAAALNQDSSGPESSQLVAERNENALVSESLRDEASKIDAREDALALSQLSDDGGSRD